MNGNIRITRLEVIGLYETCFLQWCGYVPENWSVWIINLKKQSPWNKIDR